MMRDTSLLAYYDALKGVNESQKAVYHTLLQMGAPATMREIANYMGIPINRITPRVGELRAIGWVNEHDKRPDSISGRMSYAYSAEPGKDYTEPVRTPDVLPCPIDSRISTYSDMVQAGIL